jgi:hypothetical protein
MVDGELVRTKSFASVVRQLWFHPYPDSLSGERLHLCFLAIKPFCLAGEPRPAFLLKIHLKSNINFYEFRL